MTREQNDLGRRYEEYQTATGNLFATGYALAAENAQSALHAVASRLWRTLCRSLKHTRGAAAQLPTGHRTSVPAAHARMIAR